VSKIIFAGQDLMIKFMGHRRYVPKLIQKGVDIIISFLNGIEKAIPRLRNKALSVARTFLNNLADGLAQLADIGFNAIIRFLNGLARAIRQNSRQLADAGANVANAIIDAMTIQFGRLGGSCATLWKRCSGFSRAGRERFSAYPRRRRCSSRSVSRP
jgi:hypothetical protein